MELHLHPSVLFPTVSGVSPACGSLCLPGLWKCCTVLFTVPDECALGVVGVFGVDGVCVLWVLVLGMVEPGEDPPGDRLSSHSLVSLDRFWKRRGRYFKSVLVGKCEGRAGDPPQNLLMNMQGIPMRTF